VLLLLLLMVVSLTCFPFIACSTPESIDRTDFRKTQTYLLLALPTLHLGDFGCVAVDVIDLTRPISRILYDASSTHLTPKHSLLPLILLPTFRLCQ
jgi:hypothetical protein